MIDEAELRGFRPDRYLARSWALLTREKGWIKPVLLMSVALLVPVAGILGVMGYVIEWARLTSWGVNSGPKRHDVRLSKCLASGGRAFLVTVGLGICWGLAGGVLAAVPLFGVLLGMLWGIANFFAPLAIMVAVLRCTIYQRIRAGFRVTTIWEMISRDPYGLLRIFGMGIAGEALAAVVVFAVVLGALATTLPQIIYLVSYAIEYSAVMDRSLGLAIGMQLLASLFSAALPALIVLYVVVVPISVILLMLLYTALGLWMRQFDVPAWGREEDPLPHDTRRTYYAQPLPPTPPARSPEAEATHQPAPATATDQTVAPAPSPEQWRTAAGVPERSVPSASSSAMSEPKPEADSSPASSDGRSSESTTGDAQSPIVSEDPGSEDLPEGPIS